MVLVSNQFKFIFLKTRKTAGTSIEMALEAACAPPGHVVTERTHPILSKEGIVGGRMTPPDAPLGNPLLAGRWQNHKSAALVALHLGPMKFLRYRKISAVRDPFSRCVSLFYWQGRRASMPADDDFSAIRQAFQKFICHTDWPDDRKVVSILGHVVVEDFVRFESIQADLARISQRLSVPVDFDHLAHTKNYSVRKGSHAIEEYYDNPSVEAVRRKMRWVFDRFDYPDQPVSPKQGEAI